MAFNVTPTSGTAPYTYTAEFVNRLGFDLGLYVTEFRSVTLIGSCPTDALSGPNVPGTADNLLNSGVHIAQTSVPAGECRRTVYLVRRLSDNEIVSQMSVNIDNVE